MDRYWTDWKPSYKRTSTKKSYLQNISKFSTHKHNLKYSMVTTRSLPKVSDLPSFLLTVFTFRHPADGVHQSSDSTTVSWKAVFGMAFSTLFILISTVSLSNWSPLSGIFNIRYCQKSQRAMSGQYGGWRSCTAFCFGKNCYALVDYRGEEAN